MVLHGTDVCVHPCCAAQADVKVQNMVTLGATALNNNSAAYASYAILIDQAIGQQVPTAYPCISF